MPKNTMKREIIEEILRKLKKNHMPTVGLTLTKKVWRDGFNAGKDDIVRQLLDLRDVDTPTGE